MLSDIRAHPGRAALCAQHGSGPRAPEGFPWCLTLDSHRRFSELWKQEFGVFTELGEGYGWRQGLFPGATPARR